MKIDKKDIEAMDFRLIDGIKNSDLDFLEKGMHNVLLGIAPNGEIINKEMDLASHRAGSMVVEELTLEINDIQIIDDAAVVIVTYDTKGTMLGNPIEGRFKYNRVWKTINNELKIISDSCMQV